MWTNPNRMKTSMNKKQRFHEHFSPLFRPTILYSIKKTRANKTYNCVQTITISSQNPTLKIIL